MKQETKMIFKSLKTRTVETETLSTLEAVNKATFLKDKDESVEIYRSGRKCADVETNESYTIY